MCRWVLGAPFVGDLIESPVGEGVLKNVMAVGSLGSFEVCERRGTAT